MTPEQRTRIERLLTDECFRSDEALDAIRICLEEIDRLDHLHKLDHSLADLLGEALEVARGPAQMRDPTFSDHSRAVELCERIHDKLQANERR